MTTEISTIALMKSNNLSDINALSGRMNLGLGSMATQSVSGFAGAINSNLTLYVATSGNDSNSFTQAQSASGALATPHQALALLAPYYINPNATVTISVGSGTFNLSSSIVFNHPCGKNIQLIGTSTANSSSAVSTSNTTTFNYTTNCIGILIDNISSCYQINNIYLKGGTAGAKNAGIGLQISNGSCLVGIGGIFKSEFWQHGIAVTSYSQIATCNGLASINNANFGIYVSSASTMTASGSYIQGNGSWGVFVDNGAHINYNSSTIISNQSGICIHTMSKAYLTNITVQNNIGTGIQASNNGIIFYYAGTCTGNNPNSTPAFNTWGNVIGYIMV